MLRRLQCMLFGHRYEVWQVFSPRPLPKEFH